MYFQAQFAKCFSYLVYVDWMIDLMNFEQDCGQTKPVGQILDTAEVVVSL